MGAELNFSVAFDPYSGLPESAVTSNPIDLRDAFDFTLSARTSAGTASTWTYQVSNWSGYVGIHGAPPEATFSDWTSVSGATVLAPILGVRYARILRDPSAVSFIFEAAKYVR